MKKIITLFTIFFCAASIQAQSKIITQTMQSEVLKAERAYTVILPASYDKNPNKKYPVLYLLHGMWGSNLDWAQQGNAKAIIDRLTNSGESCEMVIITPNAGGGDPRDVWNGYFDMDGWKYETFFYTEFLPKVEKEFRIIGDKSHRAIAGLSMGGGGATAYAQKYPDMFCAVYAMSALMELPNPGVLPDGDPETKMYKLNQSVIENSCTKFVTSADENRKNQLRTISWFVDCGDDDFLLDRNIEFYQAMRNAGIPCQFRVRDGGHDWEYWHTALYECLPFVTRNFGK